MKQDVKELWIIIGTTAAVYGAIRFLLPLFVPFLFSYFFACLFYPIVRRIKKKCNLSGTLVASVLTGFCAALIGGGIFYLIRTIISQVRNLIQMLPVYEAALLNVLQQICTSCDKALKLATGTSFGYVNTGLESIVQNGKKQAMELFSIDTLMGLGKLFAVGWVLFVILFGIILIVKDMDDLKIIYQESIFFKHGSSVFKGLGEIGMAYGKAQLIIIGISCTVCTIAFFLIGNRYALLLGAFVSIFDALPVLGSGLVLIPWAIVYLFTGEWLYAAILVTTFVICEVARELLETKIIGSRIGIKPIFTIMSVYAGVQLFGVFGFILGPIALMIIKTILKNQL